MEDKSSESQKLNTSIKEDFSLSDSSGESETLMLPRREFLTTAAVLLTGTVLAGPKGLWPDVIKETASRQHYRIGIADLMIYQRQKIGSFALSEQLGADGVEVDMGGLGDRPTFNSKLSDPAIRDQFLADAKSHHQFICSIAMTGFYAQSFAERPTWKQMFSDSIETMKQMGVKIGFLPFGINVDLIKRPELRLVVIERLKWAGEKAATAGVVIGIESGLDAAGELALLKAIDSKGIRSYFNFEVALDHNRDVCKELQLLGKEWICQIHGTNADGVHLEMDPKVNMPRIKKTLDKMRWSGWLVLQRSRDQKDPRNVPYNFGANARYMQSIFNPKTD